MITSMTFATHAHQHGGAHVDKAQTVLISGIAGLITYLIVGGLSGYFENKLQEEEEREHEAEEEAARTGKKVPAVVMAGKAAFFMFLYLEVLDASFSFDGVIGAFAVTNDIVLMALGLGIGAMYVRSLTVYLVRQGTLDDYVYLEHGAHYAIGALAVILLVTIDRTHAKVTLYPSNGPRIEIDLDERQPQARSCAVVSIENVKGELVVHREVKFVYGFQAELDRLYGWGLQWGRGYKTKVG
ncbi:hypothetical protein SALBM135S_04575 [Streptomyces alboniger]